MNRNNILQRLKKKITTVSKTGNKAGHLRQGEAAEAACCRFLQSRGLLLVERNFHSRYGEIDLVMADDDTLVFVEVRYRSTDRYGGGLASVTPAKQAKLRKTAEIYLQKNTRYKNARFDVVSMSKNNQTSHCDQHYCYDWVDDAF